MIKQQAVTIKLGDTLMVAMWMDGRETKEDLIRFKSDAGVYFENLAADGGLVISLPTYAEKKPNDERVPPVPGNISGPNVRLFVVEVDVVGKVKVLSPRSFLADLDHKDLEVLREATRAVHRIYDRTATGQMRTLTDRECDEIIEEVGPQSALNTLRHATGDVLH